jgi:hypothetical protein
MQPIAPGRGGSRKLPQQEVGARPEYVKEGEVKIFIMKARKITIGLLLLTLTLMTINGVMGTVGNECTQGQNVGKCTPRSNGYECVVPSQPADCNGVVKYGKGGNQ